MSKAAGIWQRFDSYGEVSLLVVKAYVISLLLLAVVLMCILSDDAWTQLGYSSGLDVIFNGNFSVVEFTMNMLAYSPEH